MNATITFSTVDIKNLIREHLNKHPGIERVTTMEDCLKSLPDGNMEFDGYSVNVVLKDNKLP